MIDRLVQHAEVHSLKGDSYRMRGRQLGRGAGKPVGSIGWMGFVDVTRQRLSTPDRAQRSQPTSHPIHPVGKGH
ncbi:hypothetical protein ABZ565_34565 [Streptomyces sp. NPDC016469]|uniref:hypothetical protein n=1 Tax=Streptomyces sp. NPDC016469 TaxID=3157191 RepID=UPI0033D11312